MCADGFSCLSAYVLDIIEIVNGYFVCVHKVPRVYVRGSNSKVPVY